MGAYMPDGIALYTVNGETYILTANEGDAREWGSGDTEYVNEIKETLTAADGTQAEKVSERYGIPAISTGAIIRNAIKTGTPMGTAAKAYTEKGALVPDEVVIGIIKERLEAEDCKGGFILDGFPRTIPQAEALDAMGVIIDRVIDIEVPDEKIVTRMSGRRVCEKCGASYHVDTSRAAEQGFASTFLRSDAEMWGGYWWDIEEYPECAGPLSYAALTGQGASPSPGAEDAPGTESTPGAEASPAPVTPSGEPAAE